MQYGLHAAGVAVRIGQIELREKSVNVLRYGLFLHEQLLSDIAV